MSDRVQISIYSHDGNFIDALYDSDKEFEGQAYAPQITVNSNGQKNLSLTLPLRILSKDRSKYIDNPRWEFITKQYKVRVIDKDGINEYVLRDYQENHTDGDQITLDATFMSLAEFELSQLGYEIEFNENTLRQYASNEDPNDPDNQPIGAYNSDIHFWEKKLLENVPSWGYRVESYYEVDKEMENDNRQEEDPTSDMKTGKEQFYEDDRIISYDEDNNPIKSDEYEIKQRILTVNKSNIWNIQQEICEKFECWPTFEILYDEEGQIKSKTIVLKNDLPQDALFSIDYKKNLKSIQRTVDSSQVVTKMYVTDLDNENVNEGIVSISTNDKNYMKENYLLDLSWFLGENDTDSDLHSEQLIDPNLSLTFKGSIYATPNLVEKTVNNTKDVINQHKTNIRYRNIYIENKSLELTRAREELTNLKAELELKTSSRDSAQEQYNDIDEEWALCPDEVQTKENRKCYIYTEDGIRIVKFSEVGVRESNIPTTFTKPINLVFNDGTKVTEENINQLQWTPCEYDEIIGTVTKMQVLNVKLGPEQSYGCFSCDLSYFPLEFYTKLKKYWKAKINEYQIRINELGKPKDQGGSTGLIPELETKIEQLKAELYNAQKEKKEAISQFENLLFPYIREGFWEDTDYGIYSNSPYTSFKMIPKEQPLENSVLGKVDWKQDYFCFFIPNEKICDYETTYDEVTYDDDGNAQIVTRTETKSLGLYDVIDIDSIEVMTGNPAIENTEGNFKTYVKGTDYEVQFGYTTYDIEAPSQYKRGIYVTFYQLQSIITTGVGINKDTQLYIRAKARGSNPYIYTGYVRPEFTNERPYFAELERILEIDTEDVILSSVKVELTTGLVSYPDFASIKTATQQKTTLEYGTDYYTYKEMDDKTKKTLTKVHLNTTTNCPLMTMKEPTDAPSWFNVTYEQDVTGKFYYNDALEVMKTSCFPQVSYSINVLDISTVLNPELKVKDFRPEVGTKVPIYDEELNFFGLIGFISSITYDLLEPQNTTLSITNFKDKFEDLFQKITASTVAIESKEYNYDKTTTITNSTGEIRTDLIMDSLKQNNMALALSPNNDVVWDNSGITVTNKELNKQGVYGKLKITSNGIFIANKYDDTGNYAWTTAITPDFINANAITVGNLDTRQIQIFNSSEPRFIWNETGLYAYGEDSDGYTDFDTYVLFNDGGLTFRELSKFKGNITLENLFVSSFKESYQSWTYVGDTQTLKQETINEKVLDYVTISNTTRRNSIKAYINSSIFKTAENKPRIIKKHKYYYSIKIRFNNIPKTAAIDLYGGFSGRYKELEFDNINEKEINGDFMSSGWNIISGFADNIDNTGTFGIIAALTELNQEWSIDIADPIVIDVTDSFGDSVPAQNYLDEMDYFVGEKTNPIENFDVYQTSVSLGWNGLSIGAQENVVQLTSTDGLVIYQPKDLQKNYLQKQMKLQLGTWTDDDGTQMFGLRGLDIQGHTIFEISQRGVYLSYGASSSTTGNIFGDMETIPGTIDGINSAIGNINTDITNLGDNVTVIKGDIVDINGNLTNISGNIDAINGNITDINGDIDTINGNITDINGNITDINEGIDGINNNIDGINNNITNINGSLTSLKGQYAQLNITVKGIQSTVGTHTETIANIQTDMESFDTNLIALDNALKKLDIDLGDINSEYWDGIKNAVDDKIEDLDIKVTQDYTSKIEQTNQKISATNSKVTTIETGLAGTNESLGKLTQTVTSGFENTAEQFQAFNTSIKEINGNITSLDSRITASEGKIALAVTRKDLKEGTKDGTALELDPEMVRISWNDVSSYWEFIGTGTERGLNLYYSNHKRIFNFNDNYLSFYDATGAYDLDSKTYISYDNLLSRFDRRDWIFYRGQERVSPTRSTTKYKVCSIGQSYFQVFNGAETPIQLALFNNVGIQLNDNNGKKKISIKSTGIDMYGSSTSYDTLHVGDSYITISDQNNGRPLVQLNARGSTFYKNNVDYGYVGSSQWAGYPNSKGLALNLEYTSQRFISFGAIMDKDKPDPEYISLLNYRNFGDKTGWHLGASLYTNGNSIRFRSGYIYTDYTDGYALRSGDGTDALRISNTNIQANKQIRGNEGLGASGADLFVASAADMNVYRGTPAAFYRNILMYDGTTVDAASDGRLKKNIASDNINALELLSQIKTRQFDWKKDDKHEEIGFIAQELEEISENFINKTPQYDANGNIVDYLYSVREMHFIPYLIKAIQELYDIVKQLQAAIPSPISIKTKTSAKNKEVVKQYDNEEVMFTHYASQDEDNTTLTEAKTKESLVINSTTGEAKIIEENLIEEEK